MTTPVEIEQVLVQTVLPEPSVNDKRIPDRSSLLDEKIFKVRRQWFDAEYRWHECDNYTGIATEVALKNGCLNSMESVVAAWYGMKNLVDLIS